MVFDSTTFLVFFVVFWAIYWSFTRSHSIQNVIALIGSLIFYGWWDWRFLALLLITAGADYIAGYYLDHPPARISRKAILVTSLSINLGILFVFKYFGFFCESFAELLQRLGQPVHFEILRIALPVGISFYTFQSMSYTIDVYRRECSAERNAVTYFTFVCFFPHMVAGPIQRPHHLLKQLNQPRTLSADSTREAIWLLLYGYFLKEYVANGCALFADQGFRVDQQSGFSTLLATLAFGFQIYADFNGYSLIARGCGKLLGIEFVWNFNQPYFADSIQDFWRRWHISLSTWLRDYLYIPLGGSRRGHGRTYLNLFVTMLLGGLWHGAAWTFMLWGAVHGGALAVERALRQSLGSRVQLPHAARWFITMCVVFFGWFLFRCESMGMVSAMLQSLANLEWDSQHSRVLRGIAVLTLPIVAIELWQFTSKDLLVPTRIGMIRFALLGGVLLAVTATMFNKFSYAFIYFQF
ncbi:MAG: MBOAT family O-acyltransferase [Myxococcota bacterium]